MRKQPKSWQAALLLASVVGLGATAAPVSNSVPAQVTAPQANGACTGVVVDENGEPLTGATVRVDGTNTAAMADLDGNFSLNGVKNGAKLTVTFIGYQPATVTWNGSPLTITLKSSDTVLDEVVVMGYGVEQKRAKVTNSITKVSDKTLTTGLNANPAQALVGAASGVKVNLTSGDPGATPSIVIRGGTDWSGNNTPLFVVDGQIRSSMSDINPNDIADMQILKDAGATALYGARAANGVILITSKSGTEANGKVSFSAKYGVNHYNSGYNYADAETYITYMRRNAYMFDSGKYEWGGRTFPAYWGAAYSNLTASNSPYGTGRTELNENQNYNILKATEQNAYLLGQGWSIMDDPINEFTKGTDRIMYRETDMLGYNLNQNSSTQDYNMSFSGGNDKGNYYASMGYYNADGALPTSYYKRYNFSFTGGYKIMNWLRANSIFNYNRANWKTTGSGAATVNNDYVFGRYASCPPTARIDNEAGEPLFGYGGFNLKFQPEKWIQNNQTDKFQMNQSLTATLFEGMTLKGSMNWLYSEGWGDWFTRDYISNQTGSVNTNRGTGASFNRSFETTYNLVANFNRTFKDAHTVNAMLGYEFLKRNYRELGASGSQAPTDDFSNLQYVFTGSQSPYKPSTLSAYTNYYTDALMSYFGRVEYDYMDKYLIAGTLRGDGYSRLLNNRWGWFPGVSGGWVFSKENFWTNTPALEFINYGKLRSSYGMNGIVNSGVIGYYSLQGSYSGYKYGDITGFRISGLPNPNLRWERTRTAEVGVDLGFLNNRINFGMTYYNRVTMDKYADKTLAPTTGFSSVKSNNGKYGNQGVELDLNTTIFQNADFRWTLGANLTYNINRVIELPENENKNFRQGGIEVYTGTKDEKGNSEKMWVGGLQVGEEPNHMWGFKQSHMLRSWEDVEALGDYIDISTQVGSKKLYATPAGLARLKEMGLAAGAIQLCPGDMVWKDANGDNMIDNYDQFNLGNITPHWTGGLNTSASWKGLTLYLRTDFGFGFTVYDGAYSWAMGGGQGSFGFMDQVKDSWTPQNTNAKYPRYLAGSQLGSNNWMRTSDLLATSGAYIAFRELQLSYQIPANICKKFRAQNLGFSLTGQNLGYIKKTTLPLPDNTVYTNGSTGGYGGTYPLPINLIFGLNVSF